MEQNIKIKVTELAIKLDMQKKNNIMAIFILNILITYILIKKACAP